VAGNSTLLGSTQAELPEDSISQKSVIYSFKVLIREKLELTESAFDCQLGLTSMNVDTGQIYEQSILLLSARGARDT
jgi:hypothetical protein